MKPKSSSKGGSGKGTIRWSYVILGIVAIALFVYFMWMISFLHPAMPGSGKIPEVTAAPKLLRIDPTLSPTKHPAYTAETPRTDNIPTKPAVSINPFPAPMMFDDPELAEPAVLVVGGTDGSGTRRVVQILTSLGVTMVSEDPETYDIHADLVGGWPEVVKPVLRETHSLMYDPDSLKGKQVITTQLSRLLAQVDRDSSKPESKVLAVGGVLQKPKGAVASRIKYGFKAPVAMTLTPWWAKLLPHFKMVHAVRDGRDIAFSANQGPVLKFFADMYGGSSEPGEVKAIRLWSDWNSQVYEWSKKYFSSLRAAADPEKSFGYLAVHSEDLVSQDAAVQFAAVYHMAKFVGSNLDEQALCCLAIKDSKFMGSHDRSQVRQQDAEAQLASRYGKWKTRLENNQRLRDSMYAKGGSGLSVLGYEPLRSLADGSMTSPSGYQCTYEQQGCPAEEKAAVPDVVGKPEDWTIVGMCEVQAATDFKGEDISAMEIPGNDKKFCCRKCKETAKCNYFTIDPANRMCYLKFGNSFPVKNDRLISGSVVG